ncbi:MAG: hypothetical protein KZQ66_04610 [Candidatus Thiodiazotropha sp. (ex Lucinoma aequizonata)]|nr:hypothetical protein [Candidatus Thiodiazotropha sp. (ex Lucinoma aequizonata)]MCU7899666.1 hypothetical protein [Candidatus Thiodiazotropha sp. (ex Lucinoma aequizonata)]MCU7901364.1 hypothetical protein [Candidatus Thiodiazotropha sp. (ex Lucinoma aequizonata)]MCU7910403.1 hypothetical protein [Candidatus Thiodiazotropha sp. (ex Lucinoma aequizonata)]MCU7913613.1 hypothetical protein [Candidatus Thiodiazotropha sp. (ex Lucinoma aequizonata)]
MSEEKREKGVIPSCEDLCTDAWDAGYIIGFDDAKRSCAQQAMDSLMSLMQIESDKLNNDKKFRL